MVTVCLPYLKKVPTTGLSVLFTAVSPGPRTATGTQQVLSKYLLSEFQMRPQYSPHTGAPHPPQTPSGETATHYKKILKKRTYRFAVITTVSILYIREKQSTPHLICTRKRRKKLVIQIKWRIIRGEGSF